MEKSSNSNMNSSSNFRRHGFTIPPPALLDLPSTSQGPFLFPRYYHNPPNQASGPYHPGTIPPTTLIFPGSTPTRAPSSFTFPSSDTDTPPHGSNPLNFSSSRNSTPTSSEDSPPSSASQGSSRGKHWSDAETRFLLEIWWESYPISKRRNSGASIATQLNKVLTDQGIKTFRSGAQCKTRLKHLEDEYKRVKDHNDRSGNNRETFEYYEELDVVLGCKPNKTPRVVLDCGLDASDESPSDSSVKLPDEKENDDDYDDEEDDLYEAPHESPRQDKKSSQKKKIGKRKQPASKTPAKKARKSSSQFESELFDFLNVSQEKDHEFFCTTGIEGERA